jgi:hypothetical protein
MHVVALVVAALAHVVVALPAERHALPTGAIISTYAYACDGPADAAKILKAVEDGVNGELPTLLCSAAQRCSAHQGLFCQ